MSIHSEKIRIEGKPNWLGLPSIHKLLIPQMLQEDPRSLSDPLFQT